jgi:hypothetical protein
MKFEGYVVYNTKDNTYLRRYEEDFSSFNSEGINDIGICDTKKEAEDAFKEIDSEEQNVCVIQKIELQITILEQYRQEFIKY